MNNHSEPATPACHCEERPQRATKQSRPAQPAPAVCDDVWLYISRHHLGRDNAIKEHDLARVLGLSARRLQQILQKLTNEFEKPIASSCGKPPGVYVPATSAEKSEYGKQLESRIIQLAKRLRAITRIPVVKTASQTNLFPENFNDAQAN